MIKQGKKRVTEKQKDNSNETWQIKAIWYSRLDPGIRKEL